MCEQNEHETDIHIADKINKYVEYMICEIELYF